MIELRDAVTGLLEQHKLSDERLGHLQQLQERSLPRRADTATRGKRAYAGFAVLLLLILPIVAWNWLSWQGGQLGMPERIAKELADNHLHLKPLEVQTNDMSGVRSYFKQLDFLPTESAFAAQQGLALIGGRYCSVQGVAAAQLRMQSSRHDGVQTLYQAPYDRDRFGPLPQLDKGEAPLELTAKGLHVFLWVEKGILFGLIRE